MNEIVFVCVVACTRMCFPACPPRSRVLARQFLLHVEAGFALLFAGSVFSGSYFNIGECTHDRRLQPPSPTTPPPLLWRGSERVQVDLEVAPRELNTSGTFPLFLFKVPS